MRARYLDYVLFLNPENVQYGISIDDLYENMKRTADKLGMYEGDADTYARVYTLALRVEPLVFAPEMPTAPASACAARRSGKEGRSCWEYGAFHRRRRISALPCRNFQDLGENVSLLR